MNILIFRPKISAEEYVSYTAKYSSKGKPLGKINNSDSFLKNF